MPLDFYANKSWIEYDNIRITAPAIESHIVAECDMDQMHRLHYLQLSTWKRCNIASIPMIFLSVVLIQCL